LGSDIDPIISLVNLADVNVTSLQGNQVLVYNSSSSHWENIDASNLEIDFTNYYTKSEANGLFSTISSLNTHINDTVAHLSSQDRIDLANALSIYTDHDSMLNHLFFDTTNNNIYTDLDFYS